MNVLVKPETEAAIATFVWMGWLLFPRSDASRPIDQVYAFCLTLEFAFYMTLEFTLWNFWDSVVTAVIVIG